jgi:hypothetical protein
MEATRTGDFRLPHRTQAQIDRGEAPEGGACLSLRIDENTSHQLDLLALPSTPLARFPTLSRHLARQSGSGQGLRAAENRDSADVSVCSAIDNASRSPYSSGRLEWKNGALRVSQTSISYLSDQREERVK